MGRGGSQERTERATPRRLQEAVEKGQIARSRELTTLAVLLGAAGSLLLLGPSLLEGLASQMRIGLLQDTKKIFDHKALIAVLGQAFMDFLLLIAPFLAVMVLIAVFAPLALGGWTFSGQALGFKWERLNPAKGLARLFSRRALMELLKALGKFTVLAALAVLVLKARQTELLELGKEPLPSALAHTAKVLGWIFLVLTLPMVLVAVADVFFQLFEHARELRMTREEVKDELKETEGKPEIKARIRRLQQEFATRRMMDKVPAADVIINNPSHYAVALKYQHDSMKAPMVVAMGVDQVALAIRRLATGHKVPQVQSPLLARALYFNSTLDNPIPVSLYVAVAQVLVYIYQLGQEERVAAAPIVMNDVPVPPELRTE
jgi:flagellar biosynthetic protein FlhB